METFLSLNRQWARRWGDFLVKTPLTPNHITTLSLAAGCTGAYLTSFGTRSFLFLAAICLQVSFILDNCDGDIARRKSLQSVWGQYYDFVCDLVVEISLWTGLALGTLRQGFAPVAVYAIASAAVVGSVMNFVRVIAYRQTHAHPAVQIPSKETDAPAGFDASRWLERLGGDADPTFFVWLMALLGYPGYFLLLGCVYVNLLWLSPLYTKRS